MKEFLMHNTIETQKLAALVAQSVYPGLVITLTGDLGAGKTTFTQGFAQKLGVTARVKSPTFNIMNTYQSHQIPIYHFDAYRLEETGAEDQGFEDYIGTDGVTLIEWPQYMADLLPNNRLDITLSRGVTDDERLIKVTGLGQAAAIEDKL
ncbi:MULTISPECIES: tRNA (adenosine(37)-N6)-threonylcarbamoyltransferase complex ATPase subunit type 1 TsaE [Leuconostoc]|jgi:tRNA threonylcarbamoyladenosine biosynthesis protein TsaE|uniref:tRNA threonylcarbamoyladenosine biosynthesis protein TsaE n=2 Tax=Leuconostoc citreum TaxID=33964 RepID=B1MXS7_LEUCK|nr:MULTISPECIES: tRNA (adenosine(37)-N6)-threonylcarbamoyltransferase complex ATPase subunit type 1 TsaE [Leuconostoc]ACA82329.1 Predicted ATPase or kinase [Leuconostoc citreum KM20]MBA5937335.1 tRNA (adenosine(37)-N6)-threonylcarbamoyltransferase complex ATPase subunit type 1 TsaE [Leuconostoc citreum]MBE4725909.1 tRNA (adenosine(37)-N6)-threonylcarbamoyltransferase complex ATPase subunit type 1 TsaE [Leuconostoc citreum]MBU7450541.1 tRNA (adenosine(37)-N6)-threonylcarbamoyltransferase complex